MTNKELRIAIIRLITSYQKKTWNGCSDSCSLCQVFKIEEEITDVYKCQLCPNSAFKRFRADSLPCVYRRSYPIQVGYAKKDKKGNYKYEHTGIDMAIKFWSEVLLLINDDGKKFKMTIKLTKALINIDSQFPKKDKK